MDGKAAPRARARQSTAQASTSIDAPQEASDAQPPLPLSSKSADNKAQARRGPTPADSPRTPHRSTSPPAERQHPPVTPPQTPPPSPEDPLETSPELPPHHPKPTPFAEDIQANPQFETLDHHQAIHSRGSATPSAAQVPPPSCLPVVPRPGSRRANASSCGASQHDRHRPTWRCSLTPDSGH